MQLPLLLFLVFSAFLCIVEADHHTHINSVGLKRFPTGCRRKIGGNILLPGGAGVCHSLKPLKPANILRMSKSICAEGWNICKEKKFLQQVSWLPHKMPDGCYAFSYGKKTKFAGYGKDCGSRLYFNGALCCPSYHNDAALKKHYALKTNKIL